jgi:hypothetical protein
MSKIIYQTGWYNIYENFLLYLTFDPDSLEPSAAAGDVEKGVMAELVCALMITLCEGAKGTPMRLSFTALLAP